MMNETAHGADALAHVLTAGAGAVEQAEAHGVYRLECRDADGLLLWSEVLDNVVCTAGKNAALDAFLAGSAYSVTGPYIGLISSTSFTAVAAGDTMASHGGWLEAGGTNAPTYTGNRPTAAWSGAAAGAKALSSAASFTFSGAGTVQGVFLVLGSGAVATKDSTAGVLYSASALGTPQPVISGNVLSVSYSASL